MFYTQHFILLCLLLLVKSIAAIYFIQYGGVGLGPDEAQYWTWSRMPDLGYYSKPPGIAWQIWSGCFFFGNTELGVRIGSCVLSVLIAMGVFGLGRACGLKPITSFWAGVAMAFIPIGIMSSFLAITDGGMILFWTLAALLTADALRNNCAPNYFLLGGAILCGALFKWPIYSFWLLVLGVSVFRPFFISWKLLFGVLISLAGLLPSFIWNSRHDWVTFRHVFATIHGGGGDSVKTSGNFLPFLGEQIVLLSPILFILLLGGFYKLWRERKTLPAPIQFCGWSCFVILAVYLTLSLFKKMQGNWCVYAYPAGVVFLTWYACEGIERGKKWLQAGLALSLVLCMAALAIPAIQSQGWLSGVKIPYRMNPFRHNVGWDRLGEELTLAGYNPEKGFLFGDKYQTCSILSFYAPGQKRAYFLNLHGVRLNQFSFWPGMKKEQAGRDGYFVVTENGRIDPVRYEKLLKNYFQQVSTVGVKPLFWSYGDPVKWALIVHCKGYNGHLPAEPSLY